MGKVFRVCRNSMAVALAGILSISAPLNIQVVYSAPEENQNETAFNYSIREEENEAGESVTISMEIDEYEGIRITEIILPDDTRVYANEQHGVPGFLQSTETGNTNIVSYQAKDNGVINFIVKYEKNVGESVEEREQEIVYEVTKVNKNEKTEEIENNTPLSEETTIREETAPKEEKEEIQDAEVNFLKKESSAQIASNTSGTIGITAGQHIETDNLIVGENERFNITVRYSPSAEDVERKLKIVIPEGFVVTKIPSASDMETVSAIGLLDNTIEVDFDNKLYTTTSFEFQVQQDKAFLYANACTGTRAYYFQMEGFSGENSVLKKDMELQVRELAKASFEIELDSKKSAKDVVWPINKAGYASVNYSLTITKGKQTKREEDFRIKIPKELVSNKYSLFTSVEKIAVNQTTYLGNVLQNHFLITDEGTHWVVIPQSEDVIDEFQNGYTSDNVMKFTINCREQGEKHSRLFQNKKYESLEAPSILVGNEEKEQEKLVLNTTDGMESGMITGYSNLNGSRKWVGDTSWINIQVGANPSKYSTEYADVIIEIPEELQIIEIPKQSQIKEIRTSKGRVIKEEEVPLLSVDETVTQIAFDGMIPHHQYIELKLQVQVREKTLAGTDIQSGTISKMQVSATSKEPYLQPYEKDMKFTIIRKDQDDLKMEIKDLENDNARIGMRNEQISAIILSGDRAELHTQSYQDAKIRLWGKEALSLTDYLKFSGNDTAFYQTMSIRYQTNLSTQEREIGVDEKGESRFPLKTGEYITDLYIVSKEFDICRESGANELIVSLMSNRTPDQLPTGGYGQGEELLHRKFDITAAFTSSNSEVEREDSGNTAFFVEPIEEQILSFVDLSSQQIMSDRQNEALGVLKLSKIANEDRITYEQLSIDLSASSPELLSMITGFRTSATNAGFTWKINTNQRKGVVARPTEILSLGDGEYVTALWLIWDETSDFTPVIDYTVEVLGSPNPYSKLTGQYMGDEYQNYTLQALFQSDRTKAYIVAGETLGISARSQVHMIGGESGMIDISEDSVYQGNKFAVSLNSEFKVANATKRKFRIEKPTFYIEIDSRYSYVQNSAKVANKETKEGFRDGQLLNGNSVLELTAEEYMESFQTGNVNINIDFELQAKDGAVAMRGVQPVKTLWADFEESKKLEPRQGWADILLENLKAPDPGLLDKPIAGLYKWITRVPGGQEILGTSEIGAEISGIKNDVHGMKITGHDNDQYGLSLTVNSDSKQDTKDWVIYLPVPKKNESASLKKEALGDRQNQISQFDLNLTSQPKVTDTSAEVDITYSTEKNPEVSMSGKDVGNYTTHVGEWSKVTMVKIKIPKLSAGKKLTILLQYTSEKKQEIGQIFSYGSGCFNMKIGKEQEYIYGEEGMHLPSIDYLLTDYYVSGTVWEEIDKQRDDVLGENDARLEKVNLVAMGNHGDSWHSITDIEGKYTIVIPSSGEYTISAEFPKHVHEEYTYQYVEAGVGTEETSSVFDSKKKSTKILLNKNDLTYINLGVYREKISEAESDKEHPPFQITAEAVNGKIDIIKGNVPPDITTQNKRKTTLQIDAKSSREVEDVSIRYGANIHYRLANILISDMEGHTYNVTENMIVGSTIVQMDEETGTIHLRGVEKSLSLRAIFEEEPTYAVRFYTEKGNASSLLQTNDGLYSGNYVGKEPIQTPKRAGYKFLGWSTTGDVSGLYTGKEMLTNADLEYFAVWE